MGTDLVVYEGRPMEISIDGMELPCRIMEELCEKQIIDLMGFQRGFHTALTKVQDLIRSTSLLSNAQKKELWKQVKAMK